MTRFFFANDTIFKGKAEKILVIDFTNKNQF